VIQTKVQRIHTAIGAYDTVARLLSMGGIPLPSIGGYAQMATIRKNEETRGYTMIANTLNHRRPMFSRRHCLWIVTAVLLVPAVASSRDSARAVEEDAKEKPRYRKPCQAFLVGQTEFRCAGLDNLPGVANDVVRLAATIHRDEDYDVTVYDPELGLKRFCADGGFEAGDDSPPPTKSFTDAAEKFKGHVERWLDAIPDDCEMVLFYLSSHGVVDKDGRFFIAVEDSELEIGPKPHEINKMSGIPYTWLYRTLDQCKAKTVVLVIDTCYSGSGGMPDPRGDGSFVGQYKPSGKVLVMASSKRDQQSLMYPEVRQSLFSFWFDQALKGQADTRQPKGAVDFDEIYDYVKQKVELVAPTIHPHDPHQQNPVRQIPINVEGTPPLVHPPPLSLDELLENSAELIDKELQLRPDIERVCVFQFQSSDVAVGQGYDFPDLRKTIAGELTDLLCRRAARHGEYDVLNDEHVAKCFSDREGTRSGVLKGAVALRGGPVAIVTGEIEPCFGNRPETRRAAHDALGLASDQLLVSLSIKLSYKGVVAPFAQSGGVAKYGVLTPGQAYAAHPVDLPPAWKPPNQALNKPGGVTRLSPSATRDRLAEIRTNRNGAAPVPPVWEQPDCPFDAYVLVDGKRTRQPTKLKDGVCYVPLARGDKYTIGFTCKERKQEAKRPVPHARALPVQEEPMPFAFVRVLVDGRNVLPEPVDVRRNGIDTAWGQITCRMAKPVDLDHARPFVIPRPNTYAINGFVERIPTDGQSMATARRFTVSDAPPKDVRDEERIRDQTGIITVAFYQPVRRSVHRGNVTTAGDPARIVLRLLKTPYVPGDLHAIRTFRYVTPEEFAEL